jgi:hypothetical protein
MAYPHPFNPDRYFVVTAATSAKGMFYANRLPDEVDFVIDDGRLADRDAGRPDEKVRLASGFFDHAWKLHGPSLETGDPLVRAQCPVAKVPTVASADETRGNRLDLSDLLETGAEGTFINMGRDLNWRGMPITLAGKTYRNGIAVNVSHETCGADYNLAGGGWKRLRGTIGIEIRDPAKLEPKEKENTRVVFIVKGDGKELYRSEPMRWDSAPRGLDVDVKGVQVLRLEVANETTWFCAASSVDWADLHLEP